MMSFFAPVADTPALVRCWMVAGFSLLLIASGAASAQARHDPGHDQTGVPLSAPQALPPEALMVSTSTFDFVPAVPFAHEGGETLVADLYLPKGAGPFPAVLWLHGGGWSGGDRKQLRRQAAYMAAHGVAGVAIEYRLDPKYHYPAPLFDAKEAVRWMRKNAAKYRIDPKRIAAVGSSAGGHLAALMGVTNGDPVMEGNGCCKGYSSSVQAVVAFNGIYDLKVMSVGRSRMVTHFLGQLCAADAATCQAASPVTHVKNGDPPSLIMHGTADQTAPFGQARSMVQALRAAGDTADFFIAPHAPHTFWAQKQWYVPSRDAMRTFLDHALAVPVKK